MLVNPGDPAAHRDSDAAEFGNHRKGIFIRSVITDENRHATLKRRIAHQLAHAGALIKSRGLDLDDGLAGEHFDRAVMPRDAGVLNVMDQANALLRHGAVMQRN